MNGNYRLQDLSNYASSTDDSGIRDTSKNNAEEKVMILEKELELANREKLIAAKYGIELVECNKTLEETIDKVTNENDLYRRQIETLRQELYTIKHNMLYSLDMDEEECIEVEIPKSISTDQPLDNSGNLAKCQILLDMELKYNLMEEDYNNQIIEYQSKLKHIELDLNDVQYLFEERCRLCDELDYKNVNLEKDLKNYHDSLLEVENLKESINDLTMENTVLNGKVKILFNQNQELQEQVNDYAQMYNESRARQNEMQAKLNASIIINNESVDQALCEKGHSCVKGQTFHLCYQDKISFDFVDNIVDDPKDDSGIVLDQATIDQDNLIYSKSIVLNTENKLEERASRKKHFQLKLFNYETFVNTVYENLKDICGPLSINMKDIENVSNESLGADCENIVSKNMHAVLESLSQIRDFMVPNQQSHPNKFDKNSSLYFTDSSFAVDDETTDSIDKTFYKSNAKVIIKTLSYQVKQLNKEIKNSRNELAVCLSEKNRLQQKYNHLLSKKDNLNIEIVCKNELYKFEIQGLKNKFSSLYQRYRFETNQLKKEIYEVNIQLHESIHQKLVLQNILEDIQLSKDIHTLQISDYKQNKGNEKSQSVRSSLNDQTPRQIYDFNSDL